MPSETFGRMLSNRNAILLTPELVSLEKPSESPNRVPSKHVSVKVHGARFPTAKKASGVPRNPVQRCTFCVLLNFYGPLIARFMSVDNVKVIGRLWLIQAQKDLRLIQLWKTSLSPPLKDALDFQIMGPQLSDPAPGSCQ